MEKWKIIPEILDYEVSNLGRVRNVKTKNIRHITLEKSGYEALSLKSKKYHIHRLVLCVFTNKSLNYPMDVHHKDNNKSNNNFENLLWVTRSQNIKYVYRDNLRQPVNVKGTNNGRAKLTVKDVVNIRHMSKNMIYSEIAKLYNISRSTVEKIVRRILWNHV